MRMGSERESFAPATLTCTMGREDSMCFFNILVSHIPKSCTPVSATVPRACAPVLSSPLSPQWFYRMSPSQQGP